LKRQPSGRPATLSLRHDWTEVVALSSPFSTYKYGGREQHQKGGLERDKKKKKRERK